MSYYEQIVLTRIFAFSVLPLLLAVGHQLLDRQARTPARRIELFIVYILALSVAGAGISGAFGHLFLSDLVAEAVGWPAGSPFQLEMGFANLMLGVMGVIAISRRGGFRTATITASAVLGVGVTLVHFYDIAAHGNLAPGNTFQNVGNLLDPALLIGLSWLARGIADPDEQSLAFRWWQAGVQPLAVWSLAGVGTGFSVGYFAGLPFLWLFIGLAVGISIGFFVRNRIVQDQGNLAMGE
ncbi:MAG: DUF6790 family protein [Candidatus Promineifilaceae bacterium]|nr:DUF6790 family protein [Candidatus Promineifilaceae bacterium]